MGWGFRLVSKFTAMLMLSFNRDQQYKYTVQRYSHQKLMEATFLSHGVSMQRAVDEAIRSPGQNTGKKGLWSKPKDCVTVLLTTTFKNFNFNFFPNSQIFKCAQRGNASPASLSARGRSLGEEALWQKCLKALFRTDIICRAISSVLVLPLWIFTLMCWL